jgi:hypothetical protein
MEAEYIALSQSMREVIPIREVVLEMQKLVFGGRKVIECRSHSKIFEYASSANKNETHKLPTPWGMSRLGVAICCASRSCTFQLGGGEFLGGGGDRDRGPRPERSDAPVNDVPDFLKADRD